jgi:AcrR family transcriptional regulator
MHGRRARSPRGEGDRLRVDLIEAAIALMDQHGDVDAVTLRAVARSAGVSPTAVYRHFDDHLELLREAVAFCWSTFHDAIASAARSSTDPYDSFRAAGDAYVTFAATTPGRYRVMFSNRISIPATPDGEGMVTFQILVDLVEAILRDRGDDRDAVAVAVQVHTWIHGIVDLGTSHPTGPWPTVGQQLDGLQAALRLVPPTG